MLDEIDVLRDLVQLTPAQSGRRMWSAASTAPRTPAGVYHFNMTDLLDLFAESASDFLDGWFESEPVKAAFGFYVVGNYASPEQPGIGVCLAASYVW